MAAREGMANLIRRLRGMTQADADEYEVNGASWWSDDQLQEALDAHRVDMNRVPLMPIAEVEGGETATHDYYAPRGDLEEAASGAEAWSVEDADGDAADPGDYTADYVRGSVRFTADQEGAAYYLRARAYNLAAAAAQVWRERAGWRAAFVTFRADDQQMNQSEWFEHCMAMAAAHEKQAGPVFKQIERSDLA
jgi:hypothetical protein